MKVYETSLEGSSLLNSKKIIEAVEQTAKSLRRGIGTRSKLLFTHPRNKETLGAFINHVQKNPDLFIPFPYRIITCDTLPIKELFKTGKINWKNNTMVDHSVQSNDNMTREEYIEMCVYFGWAEEETQPRLVWYECDEPTFEDFVQIASEVSKVVKEKLNDKIAAQLFRNEYNFLSPSRRTIIQSII